MGHDTEVIAHRPLVIALFGEISPHVRKHNLNEPFTGQAKLSGVGVALGHDLCFFGKPPLEHRADQGMIAPVSLDAEKLHPQHPEEDVPPAARAARLHVSDGFPSRSDEIEVIIAAVAQVVRLSPAVRSPWLQPRIEVRNSQGSPGRADLSDLAGHVPADAAALLEERIHGVTGAELVGPPGLRGPVATARKAGPEAAPLVIDVHGPVDRFVVSHEDQHVTVGAYHILLLLEGIVAQAQRSRQFAFADEDLCALEGLHLVRDDRQPDTAHFFEVVIQLLGGDPGAARRVCGNDHLRPRLDLPGRGVEKRHASSAGLDVVFQALVDEFIPGGTVPVVEAVSCPTPNEPPNGRLARKAY